MSAHHTPEEIRSNLDHPIVDGDGHWVEFDPVFAERLRKVGGDKAADGFLAAMQTTRDALGMSVDNAGAAASASRDSGAARRRTRSIARPP